MKAGELLSESTTVVSQAEDEQRLVFMFEPDSKDVTLAHQICLGPIYLIGFLYLVLLLCALLFYCPDRHGGRPLLPVR